MSSRVLIVEDEPNIVESLTFLLRREGYDVASAADGDAALSSLRSHQCDVMILDLMLPRLNGFEVLKTVRADPAFASLRVLILTAKGQAQDRRLAEDIGVDAFMTKPFANRDIVDAVRRLTGA
ncbi:MAG: response regulator transcription factor [Betaproteobacteria bacterium]|nr:response regulator [Casimicrobiaceae bacterium]